MKFFGRKAPFEDALPRTAETSPTGSIGSPDPLGERGSAFANGLWHRSVEEIADDLEPLMIIDLDGSIVAANAAARALGSLPPTPFDGSISIERVLTKVRLVNGGGSPPCVPVPAGIDFDALVSESEPLAERPIFELRSTLRHRVDGQPADWIVRFVDVTPLIVALRSRKAAADHRDQLLKLMSHDLRSPLVAILATLKHPDLQVMPDSQRRVIEAAANRALHMMDAKSRLIRAECSDYTFEPLDLSHIVEEVLDASWSLSKSVGIRLVLEPTDGEFVVLADRGSMTEALTGFFRWLLTTSGPGRVLLCGFRDGVLNGKAAVTFAVKDVIDTTSNRGRTNTSTDAVAQSSRETDRSDDSGIMLLNAVLTRHSGVTTWESEPDARQTISITVPSVDPVAHS